MTMVGGATPEGTRRFRDRFAAVHAEDQFSVHQGLWLSSIGLGTYLGEWDEATDLAYEQSVIRAVELGCNVVDSAINYRFQRSERSIGRALARLISTGVCSRDGIVLASKGGYVPFDGRPPEDVRKYYQETFFGPGIIKPDELAGGGSHCISPKYLSHQLEVSLKNLGVDCIDIYYLHNPEQQLDEVDREEVLGRIRKAFELLEDMVDAGRIRYYGTATWNGYRRPHTAPGALSLPELAGIARSVGGVDHHFRFIQLPVNLAMPEAITVRNQAFDGRFVPVVEAAGRLGITVMASASILQSRLASGLPKAVSRGLRGLRTDAQRAIQFVRSTPGIAVALVGMRQTGHVDENMELARTPLVSLEEFMDMFSRPDQDS
ncbi:MAG: aldo/keto reductase [Acidobacteria bacterium]|nr:aldo/keto reductase [Acidobacteriota bacterium]